MTADSDYEVILYRAGTAGTITLRSTNHSADTVIGGGVMARSWAHDENNISRLSLTLDNASLIPAENLLWSTCALWSSSVTGALQMGDYVRYSIYPTSAPSTKTQVFFGKITELRPTTDGTLQVTVVDYLQKFNREYNKMVFAHYKDLAVKAHTDTNGLRTITGISESDVLSPLVFVGFAVTDVSKTVGDWGKGFNTESLVTYDLAQPFGAFGDGVLDITFHQMAAAGGPSTYHISIREDDGMGAPVEAELAGYDFTTVNPGNMETVNWIVSNAPLEVISGKKYWVVWSGSGAINCYLDGWTPGADAITPNYYLRTKGGAWAASASGKNIYLQIDFANYEEVTPDNYMFDVANTRLILSNNKTAITALGSIYRGKVSYYYGTTTQQDVCSILTCLMSGVAPTTSANQAETLSLYSTIGKKLVDCFKEVADLWETTGSWAGYQHAFMAYESSGIQYIGWGKRHNLEDTPAFAFSHPASGAVDDECRIVDYTGLVNQLDVRPAGILVIGGKDANGNPIVASVSDEAAIGSFAVQMEDFSNVEKISDQNIVTQADAFKRAYAAVDSYTRGQWEGTIRVSGVYPDLFDLDPASAFFGSGKIIELNIAPLGISNQWFKVRGVVVHENETEVTISNIWSSIENRPSKTFLKTDRSEAFLAQVGMADNIYFRCFKNASCTTTPAYMVLEDGYHNELTRRVLCAIHPSSSYSGNTHPDLNLRVYHAEFEKDGGATPDGTPVSYIELFAAATGGSAVASYSLTPSGVQNEKFYKWKTQRLIVDFAMKA